MMAGNSRMAGTNQMAEQEQNWSPVLDHAFDAIHGHLVQKQVGDQYVPMELEPNQEAGARAGARAGAGAGAGAGGGAGEVLRKRALDSSAPPGPKRARQQPTTEK